MQLNKLGEAVISTLAFATLGIIVFAAAFWVMNKLAPFSLKKEIEEDHNVALAVIMAGVLIGISLIISGAVSGGG
jgi:putative membrane protein